MNTGHTQKPQKIAFRSVIRRTAFALMLPIVASLAVPGSQVKPTTPTRQDNAIVNVVSITKTNFSVQTIRNDFNFEDTVKSPVKITLAVVFNGQAVRASVSRTRPRDLSRFMEGALKAKEESGPGEPFVRAANASDWFKLS